MRTRSSSHAWALAVAVAVAALTGCGGSDKASESASSPSTAPTAEELATGQALYAAQCASCHDNPSQAGLDGNGATPISAGSFATAAAFSAYIVRAMPKGNVGACDAACADAIVAFIRNNYVVPATDDGSSATFSPLSNASALRKVKGVLTGIAPTDAELAAGTGKAVLQAQIDTWMATPAFRDKMLTFFGNTFQQSSFSTADFNNQLRNRPGALQLPYTLYGDSAFPMLMSNVKESFARTALYQMDAGKPMTDLLTTDRFMMTTALKSLYMQIEANWDTASTAGVMKWKFNYGRRPALADSLNPDSPDYMVFGHETPTTTSGTFGYTDSCTGNTALASQYWGNVYLFQLLLGSVNRDRGSGPGLTATGCWERPTKPYFTTSDTSDWQMVQVVSGTRIEPWDLPKLRASAGTLPSVAPRVGYFTTPAFLATWNTNDSNAHRVTVNQALLVALGQGFSSASQTIPIPPDTAGVDGAHAVTTSECYACHKSLDPMSHFFGNWYWTSDKPRPSTNIGSTAASFGFANVTGSGKTLVDFGNLIKQVNDTQVASSTVNRFALEMTQKLCYFANSSACDETDPEMRRVARVFQSANYNFKALVRELFSSPLVTSLEATQTWSTKGSLISVTRRDQLCQGLSVRLGIVDLCQIALPLPAKQSRMANLAGVLPYDTFSRGSAEPVVSTDPNVFYRSASELLCEAIATQVVDGASSPVFSSANVDESIAGLVTKVMALPATDPMYAGAVTILKTHFTSLQKDGASATNALRSTFTAACLAPSSVGQGI